LGPHCPAFAELDNNIAPTSPVAQKIVFIVATFPDARFTTLPGARRGMKTLKAPNEFLRQLKFPMIWRSCLHWMKLEKGETSASPFQFADKAVQQASDLNSSHQDWTANHQLVFSYH
jgi:hypothetical protein